MRPENMRMFQAAEALAGEIERILPRAKAQRPNVANHLERSLDSVILNMSEGIGIVAPKGKISAYSIARKEANEVRGALRKLVIAKVFTARETQKGYDLAGAVVGMLTRAIIATEKRLSDEETA